MLGGEGLEVPGVLQGLQLVADAPVEQADEVQAVQLELQTAVQVQEALAVCHGPPREDVTCERRGETDVGDSRIKVSLLNQSPSLNLQCDEWNPILNDSICVIN